MTQTVTDDKATTAMDASASHPALDPVTAASYEHCRHVARRQARNFYYGMRLTPEPKRSALYAVYAFMRACDDLADDARPDEDARAIHDRIEAFREDMARVIDHPDGELPHGPTWPAFAHVVRTYPIDPAHLHAMLDGQLADLYTRRYETFDQLYDYCYKVASVVGLVCVSIWGHDGAGATLKMAEQRGVALQLTNILRDVAEDTDRGRVYIPAEDLRRFGITEDDLRRRRASQPMDQLLLYQAARARRYYEQSADLEGHLDPACRPTCWAMMRIYRALLDRIEREPRRVLVSRVTLSRPAKLAIAARAMWRRSWTPATPDGQSD